MFRAGDQIGPYILNSKIGRGAFGVVWLAERRTTIATTRVALKMPLDEEIDLDTIKQEANVWVQASGHPNVVPIIEANVYDDQVVIVSEYAPDGSLDAWLKRIAAAGHSPGQSIEFAVEMAAGILAGLQHLHSRHIIHRDLKPQNILLQGSMPRLADFGISRVLRSTSQSSIVAGTPVYMAPEAFDGKRNEQTDLWSVGVMLYQMLAGRLPFPQTDMTSLMGAILTRNPDPLPISVPAPLQEVINRSLAKNTAQRYRSATEMRSALRSAMEAIRHGDRATTEKKSPPDYSPPPRPDYSPPPGPDYSPHPRPDYSPPAASSEPKKSRAGVWISTIAGVLLGGAVAANQIAIHYKESQRAASTDQFASAVQPSAIDVGADIRRWLTMLGHTAEVPEVISQTGAELAKDPLNALAMRARCSAHYVNHEDDVAKRDAEWLEAHLSSPSTAEEYEARCFARRQLEKLDDAISDCSRAIELDPQYAFARFTRGAVYYKKRNFDLSIADYNKGIELNSSHAPAYINRGLGHYMKGEYDLAIRDLTKATGLDPKSAAAFADRGIVRYDKQEYDGALADSNKAIELDPKLAAAYQTRGRVYYVRQDYLSALSSLNKSIELDPQVASAYTDRGRGFDARLDYDSAIADYNKAIQLDGSFALNYLYRGNAYYFKKDYDNALSDHTRAIQLNPKEAVAYFNRANDYGAKREWYSAIGDYTKAIELNPRFEAAYSARASAYEATGDSQRAAADREKAQELKR
ncbi:MAG: serine/threonine-protein kinase [Acidobacteriota bacterium]